MTAHFSHAMEHLKNMISELTAKVEISVHLAVQAVTNLNAESAAAVIAGDPAVDEEEIRIEEECLKILALYQPVAGDLRQVITILKINNEIERVGDLTVNIAERVPDMVKYQKLEIEKIDFSDMVSIACYMLQKSLDAMTYHDLNAAAEVIGKDDEIDQIHRDNYAQVRDRIIGYPDAASYYMNYLTVSRCLERIADIATNIAEDVIYLESGKIVRHQHEGVHYVQ